MTHIANYQNCDLVMGFLDELPTQEQKEAAKTYLLGSFSPFVPASQIDQAIENTRRSLAILAGPITGSREPDGSTGVVDCVAKMPGEE